MHTPFIYPPHCLHLQSTYTPPTCGTFLVQLVIRRKARVCESSGNQLIRILAVTVLSLWLTVRSEWACRQEFLWVNKCQCKFDIQLSWLYVDDCQHTYNTSVSHKYTCHLPSISGPSSQFKFIHFKSFRMDVSEARVDRASSVSSTLPVSDSESERAVVGSGKSVAFVVHKKSENKNKHD